MKSVVRIALAGAALWPLATNASQAAPPQQRAAMQPAAPQSTWSKLKSGVLRVLPGAEDGAPTLLPDSQPAMRRDGQVRPASANQPIARPPQPARKASRRGLFSRKGTPGRTVSEYMAQEKP